MDRLAENIRRGMLVSDEDIDIIRACLWRLNPRGYAMGKYKIHTQLHRVIIERMIGRKPSPKECADHINSIRHDNRRSNLRVVSVARNNQHIIRLPFNKTGFRGVSFITREKKFRAAVKLNYKTYTVGHFDTAEEAGEAARRKRMELGFLGE